MKYEIIQKDNVEALTLMVNNYLKDGWKPLGPAQVCTYSYYDHEVERRVDDISFIQTLIIETA